MERHLKIIGVTGGIGSGKSTVSRILSDSGAKVVDADSIAKQVVAKGEKALDEIKDCFGMKIISESGELDRKQLAEIVFNDREKLLTLNRITHKYVTDKIIEQIQDIKNSCKAEFIVVDAAIPIKSGFVDIVDVIWVVVAVQEIRVQRIMLRSGLSHQQALDRINSQMKDEDYLKVADKVITNDRSFEELQNEVKDLLKKERLG